MKFEHLGSCKISFVEELQSNKEGTKLKVDRTKTKVIVRMLPTNSTDVDDEEVTKSSIKRNVMKEIDFE